MDFHEPDTAFDPAGEAHVDSVTADHDSTLGGTDDHYAMVSNDGGSSDGSDSYGDSSNSGQSASYGDDSSSGYGSDSSSGDSTDGTDSSPDASGSAGTVSIVVDGHTYTEQGHIDNEGYNEAQFQLPDGDTVIAADTDHDSQADIAVIEDPSGQVIDSQHVDPTSGEWIDDGPGDSSSGGDSTSGDSTSGGDSYPSDGSDSSDGGTSPTSTSGDGSDGSSSDGSDSPDGSDSSGGSDTTAAAAGTVHVTVDGQTYTAAEQYDVNQDGRPDSGVVEVDGKTYLLTDFNGDGVADHAEVGENGQWTAGYSISADGQVTPDPGTTPDAGDLPGGGDGTSGFTENTDYVVDPQTGEWTTQ